MQNADIARIFALLADLLEIDNANPFRVRAYRNASRTIDGLSDSLAVIHADSNGKLTDLTGIGRIETCGRFIEENDFRLGNDRLGNPQTFAHAMGENCSTAIELRFQAHLLHHRLCTLLCIISLNPFETQ